MNQKSETSPAAVLREICMGLRAAQALYVAAKLGIADHLVERPLTSAELASATNTDPPSLRRLLRALAALGIFVEQDSDRFALTSVSHFLRTRVPGSRRSEVIFLADDVRWRSWSDLLGSVRTGEPAADRVLGMSIFDYYAAHPEESVIHDEAMAASSDAIAAAVLGSYDFSGFHCLVDVGGGSGQLLCEILRTHPSLGGILFDLPHVADNARAVLTAGGVIDRCRIESGNFFDAVPGGGDAYLLKQIVHDWEDQQATEVLAMCRRAMPADGTLLIIDRVLPERTQAGQDVEAFLSDLAMLIMTWGGRERTPREFEKLLGDAGFGCVRVLPTGASMSIIEARPA